jgi:hypothetical protein
MSDQTQRPKVLLSGELPFNFSLEIRAEGSCLGPLQYAKDELREQVGAIADVVVSARATQG